MKKAFDLLTEQGLSYEFHDYKKQGIDAKTIKTWLDALGQDVVLNKKGTTWRKLSEEEQQTALSSEDALINALTTHTSLIKRPGGVSKSMLKQSRLNFDKIEKCE